MYYHSYKSLFKIQWKIYSLDNKKPLPRPIPLDGLIAFFLAMPVSAIITLPGQYLIGESYLMSFIIINVLLTIAILKYDPQGRPVAVFGYDILCFIFRAKLRDFTGKQLQRKRIGRLYWDAMDLAALPDSMDI